MNVSPEARVVSQIPPRMIGIVINYDIVPVPIPITHVIVIKRCDAPIEIVKEEALAVAAAQMPDVAAPDAGGEPPLFKRTIQMKARIVAALIMADPLVALHVNMRRFRMASPVIKSSRGRLLLLSSAFFRPRLRLLLLLYANRRRRSHWRWTMRGNMPTTDPLTLLRRASAMAFFLPSALCVYGDAYDQGREHELNHKTISPTKMMRRPVQLLLIPGHGDDRPPNPLRLCRFS